MQHTLGVNVRQTARELCDEGRSLTFAKRPRALQSLLEVPALSQVHDKEGFTVADLDGVNAHHVGVRIDGGMRLCLSLEAQPRLGVRPASQAFDRAGCAGAAVARCVDLAHAPRAEESLDDELVGPSSGRPVLHGQFTGLPPRARIFSRISSLPALFGRICKKRL